MPSNKLDTLRNVKVVSSIEFQGESESVITFWFRYLFDVLFVVMCIYTHVYGEGGDCE